MLHALFIVAPENFRDEELFVPLEILKNAGIETTIASKEAGICRGKLGGEAEAVIGLNQVNAEDFDAIIFIGGSGSEIYFEDPAAHLIAKKAFKNGKILAAICAAPAILAKAGVLKEKSATIFPSPAYEEIMEKSGTNLTRADLEVDGKIITANGPAAAEKFGEKIVELLKK